MSPIILFNGHTEDIVSIEGLGRALDRFSQVPQFELWASVAQGPSMCMLRNEVNAWLMYLRHDGDSGFTSVGDPTRIGAEKFMLINGQDDEYPLAWCIELEQCFKAVSYFYVNLGARPAWVQWHET